MNDCLRTYILQFLYKDGNGWAIVNARTPQQAENIFKIQTKFNKPKVTSIKESKWYGENMQLVYEGTTITGNLSPYDLAVMEGYVGSLDEWLKTLKGEKGDPGEKGDKGDTFTYEDLTEEQLDKIGEHVPLNDYYTKEETNSKVESISPLIVHCAQVQGVASELYLPDVEYTTAMSAYTSGRDIIIYNVNFGYLKMTVSTEGLLIATSQTFGDSNYVFSWTPNVEPMYGDPRYGIIQQTVTRLATEEELTNYQPKLIAGAGIDITNNVISATGGGGTGIESIEQTVTSDESGGINVVTITMSDSRTADFEVMNGKKGDKGDKGDQGPKGDSGVHLGDVAIADDLDTDDPQQVLSARQGKVLGNVVYGGGVNLFNADDPTNGQMQFYSRVLSHKIYTSSRTIYTKGSRALLVYDSNDTQLSYILKESNTAGAMDKYTIADNLDFAYIRVGYTASTVVVDNDVSLHQFYYGNSVSSLFAFASPTMFNVVNPDTETFGTQMLYNRYVASDMMLVKGVNVVTVKGVNFYQLYDDGLNAVASRVELIADTSYRVETNGAVWIRLGASSLEVLRGAVLVLRDLSLNVSVPSEANFIEYVLRHINKTSSYNGTKIAVGGDSIAHGYNDEKAMGGWSGRVAKALGAELVSYTYTGASVCKRTALPEMSQYSLVERSKQIAESSDEYSAILLAYGTNDFGNATPISPLADVIATSEDEYNFTSALFYSLKRIVDAKPNANVFVVNLLARDGNSPDDANAYNEMLTEVANYLAIPVLDVRRNSGINPNVPSMKTAFMPDGLHPNAAGYERIARCIVQDGLINCYNAVPSSQTELTDNEINTICV